MKRITFVLLCGILIVSACSSKPPANGGVAVSASSNDDLPMVCTLSPGQLSAQWDALLPGLMKRADERVPLERGYRLKFAARPGVLDEISRVVEQERGCCQFLKFQITVEPAQGPIYLEVTGPEGTREMPDSL